MVIWPAVGSVGGAVAGAASEIWTAAPFADDVVVVSGGGLVHRVQILRVVATVVVIAVVVVGSVTVEASVVVIGITVVGSSVVVGTVEVVVGVVVVVVGVVVVVVGVVVVVLVELVVLGVVVVVLGVVVVVLGVAVVVLGVVVVVLGTGVVVVVDNDVGVEVGVLVLALVLVLVTVVVEVNGTVATSTCTPPTDRVGEDVASRLLDAMTAPGAEDWAVVMPNKPPLAPPPPSVETFSNVADCTGGNGSDVLPPETAPRDIQKPVNKNKIYNNTSVLKVDVVRIVQFLPSKEITSKKIGILFCMLQMEQMLYGKIKFIKLTHSQLNNLKNFKI